MKNVESYSDKLAEAMLVGNAAAVCAIIDNFTGRFSKEITVLVGKYHPVDYPLLVAAMNAVLKGMSASLGGDGIEIEKFLEERMETVIFTTPGRGSKCRNLGKTAPVAQILPLMLPSKLHPRMSSG